MIAEKKKLRICLTWLVLNLCFIWGNSLLPGPISGAISNWVKELLLTVLAPILPQGVGAGAGGGLLRKFAHFTEFACLGMCLRWLFGMLRRKKWEQLLFPFGAGVLTACMDETIQIFVPGRGPGLKDVGIDTLGLTLGIVIISLIKYHKKLNLEDKQL